MSCKGVSMHQIQEILRLSRTMKRSLREIPWPLPEGWTEQTLRNALLPRGSCWGVWGSL
ncbi:MAG: hypothetical protein ACYC9S_13520 [Leptospirales bacterium]